MCMCIYFCHCVYVYIYIYHYNSFSYDNRNIQDTDLKGTINIYGSILCVGLYLSHCLISLTYIPNP